MALQHFNYLWWDSEGPELFEVGPSGHFFFLWSVAWRKRERLRGRRPTALDKWLKTVTSDDTGLTRPPPPVRVSAHKDEVRSIVHGYFQSQFRAPGLTRPPAPARVSQHKDEVRSIVHGYFHSQFRVPGYQSYVVGVQWTSRYPLTCQTGRKHTQNCQTDIHLQDSWLTPATGSYLANGCETGSVLGLKWTSGVHVTEHGDSD